MNRKIIIIITALICLCAALITAQHFANRNTENTTAPASLSETPQTDAPSENSTEESRVNENATSNTDKTPSTAQTTKAATTAKPSTTSTTSTTKPNTTTTTKPGTTTTTKPSTTTTTKPNAATTTKPSTTTTTKLNAATTTKPSTTTTTQSTTEAEKQTITVTISINCEKALDKVDGLPESGYFLAPCKFTVKKGATVFDVLEAAANENGITLTYQSKSYIQAINGLAERDCGGGSGWTYSVNGVKPNKSAAKYELADGDIIEWYYVTSPND